MTETPEYIQRWTAKRRSALVLSIIKGETSVAEASRKYGLTVAEVERWREQFLSGGENALRSRPNCELWGIPREARNACKWRRGWDLNPRCSSRSTAVFKTAAISRSATPPLESV